MVKIWTPSWKLSDAEQFYLMMTWKWNHLKMNFKSPLLTGEKRFLVFGPCLNELLTRYECGDAIIQQKNKTSGSMLLVELTCHSGHTRT